MQAFEASGHIDNHGQLKISSGLPLKEGEVKIIMYSDEPEEAFWLKTVSKNPVFDFLKGPEEDIYSLIDGKPFND